MKNGARVNRSYTMEFDAAPEVIFPLLCPVREYEWIPHWDCEIIHTQSGYAELGCVFTTDFHDGFAREVWVVSVYEPFARIAFVRTGPVRTMRYEINLSHHQGGTRLVWEQEITALNEDCARMVEGVSQKEFDRQFGVLERLLGDFLQSSELSQA